MSWSPKVFIVAALLVAVAIYAMFCSSRDISGTYSLVKCVDVDSTEIGERAGAAGTIIIKNLSGRRFAIEHAGGSNDGTRLIGELEDTRLIVKIGTSPVVYAFASGSRSFEYNGYSGRCVYEKSN
ncbi:MAG TPA: hypothetical protein PKM65_00235 [Spirochaetota bacterium]|nr:hypothetical protein [Spirochaetota bacterium]HNT12842.1 hypothetical protein [Spirochaetota bacterium]HNV47187.1 hypothetical protein [Spirochaetota bacterium]HOS38927.1 hypothetical protein [Spirochaetota bacterium]HPU88245.1 hypothetical protein [Spirochaetota bacterium]